MSPDLVELPIPGEPLPVRKFADVNIQAQIDGAISRLEGTEHGASVTYEGRDGKHKVALVVKLNNHFSVAVADNIEAGQHYIGGQILARW